MRMPIGLLITVFTSLVLAGCGSNLPGASGMTVDRLAGTWDFAGSGVQTVGANIGGSNCGVSFLGTLAIAPDGTVILNRTNHFCGGDSTITDTGTLSVTLEGRGTLRLESGEVETFQFSTDLNKAVFANITNGGVFVSGMAMLR